jgi:hypothetical protein
MDGESLAELKAAFEKWRSKKRHVREAVPAQLLERARAAAARHGWAAVARASVLTGRDPLTLARSCPPRDHEFRTTWRSEPALASDGAGHARTDGQESAPGRRLEGQDGRSSRPTQPRPETGRYDLDVLVVQAAAIVA